MELTREYLDGELAKLTSLVDSIKTKQGSAVRRLNDATLEALGADVTVHPDDRPSPFFGAVTVNDATDDGSYSIPLADIATYVKALSEWADQVRDECVKEILSKSGGPDDLNVLRTQYDKQVEIVKALLIILPTQKIDVSDVEIPRLRSGRPPSQATQRAAGTKYAQYYRILPNGERRDQSVKQNSLSSMAWYYGAAITAQQGDRHDGKGVGVDELERFLTRNVTDSPKGKPWTYKDGATTYGMDTITAGEEEE